MVKKEGKSLMKKWWFWTIIIVVIVGGFYLIFQNEIKAYKMGVDVKYLDNPKYCEQDSDCRVGNICEEAVNIYNFEHSPLCAVKTCGAKCENNLCVQNKNCGEILN